MSVEERAWNGGEQRWFLPGRARERTIGGEGLTGGFGASKGLAWVRGQRALIGQARRAERERGGGGTAGMGRLGQKAEGGGSRASFFFLIFWILIPFPFCFLF
jgi:hypothetical protein